MLTTGVDIIEIPRIKQTLDRYGHLYGSDVEAVGVAMNALLTRKYGQNVVTDAA